MTLKQRCSILNWIKQIENKNGSGGYEALVMCQKKVWTRLSYSAHAKLRLQLCFLVLQSPINV